jgi:hypothetical protein
MALRDRCDQHHAEAEQHFRETLRRRMRLVTSNLVLAEGHRLTLFRMGARARAHALDRLGFDRDFEAAGFEPGDPVSGDRGARIRAATAPASTRCRWR